MLLLSSVKWHSQCLSFTRALNCPTERHIDLQTKWEMRLCNVTLIFWKYIFWSSIKESIDTWLHSFISILASMRLEKIIKLDQNNEIQNSNNMFYSIFRLIPSCLMCFSTDLFSLIRQELRLKYKTSSFKKTCWEISALATWKILRLNCSIKNVNTDPRNL